MRCYIFYSRCLPANYSVACTKNNHLRSPQRAPTQRRAFAVARPVVCSADRNGSNHLNDSVVYQGRFGPWQIDDYDVREVTAYREYGNLLSLLGAGSMGAALVLIHIYVTPLKRFVQALWGVGTLGALYLMATQKVAVPVYVVDHPGSMWLVGPLFAAATGLAFKEGLCYGKPESAALFFVIPVMCLAHLSGAAPSEAETGLAAAVAVLLIVFAGRKWSQPIHEDIGDKSMVFKQC